MITVFVRERGGVVVVVAHRPSALVGVNKVLAMNKGQVQAFGPRDEVLKSVLQAVPAPVEAGESLPPPPPAAAGAPAQRQITGFKVVTDGGSLTG